MDEALKQKLMITGIAGGLSFMVAKMAVNMWAFDLASVGAGIGAMIVCGGIAFAVVHFMNQ